jgi:hypothetical protein
MVDGAQRELDNSTPASERQAAPRGSTSGTSFYGNCVEGWEAKFISEQQLSAAGGD